MGGERRDPGPWCVLGPVRLVFEGREVDLGPAKQRAVLAVLLMTPGRSVPVEILIDRVWGERPPRADNAVAPYITRLRRVLDAVPHGERLGALRYTDGGYRIDCDPRLVDLHLVRQWTAAARTARQAADDERAADLLRRALNAWKPIALAGLPGTWAARMRHSLYRERCDVLAEWAGAQLRLGWDACVIDELRPAVAEDPTAEQLVAALMTALADTGRMADALDCYANLRTALADQFGSEPSAPLQELHLRLLRDGTAVSISSADPGDTTPAVPRQLPADTAGFSGRTVDLDRLDALLTGTSASGGKGVVVCAVTGPAGVGKTSLVVHWAHRVRDAFPGGQLYVDLRGFDSSGSVVDPAEALRGFLETLGVPAQRIPLDPSARAALYRSVLADRQILIVLDNARSAEQVRPLLPGHPDQVVLVTSRIPLTGLVARDGARSVPVELMPAGHAWQLLAARLGADRVAAEPRAVGEIVARCAGLPLALVIAAARAVARPTFPLDAFAAHLRTTAGGLNGFAGSDPSADLRTVFSWSYQALTPPAARLFRFLALHPGPDTGAPPAASLAGLRVDQVNPLLDELVEAHLLSAPVPGRYSFHELVRDYAAELMWTADSDEERRMAAERVFGHYLHSALAASRLLSPHREPITVDPPAAGVSPEEPADLEAALAWFAGERAVLLSAVTAAEKAGLLAYAWQLTWTMELYFDRRGQWQDMRSALRTALRAAQRLGDGYGEARMLRGIGVTEVRLGQHDEARRRYRRALTIFGRLDDPIGQAHTHKNIAQTYEQQDHLDQALDHVEEARRLYEQAGDRAGLGRTLNSLAWLHIRLGRPEPALEYGRQALATIRAIGDPRGEVFALDTVALAHRLLGHHDRAVAGFRQVLELHRAAGDAFYQALALKHLGDAYAAARQPDEARRAWHQALAIYDRLGHADAAELRQALATSP